MAHAYFIAGTSEESIQTAMAFSKQELGFVVEHNPDVQVLRFGLFSVDDARNLIDGAYRTASSDKGKILIISMTRVFHEAQNALLKLFEEPPAGVVLILCIPSAGLLLPTFRSRLLELSHLEKKERMPGTTQEFLAAETAQRDKMIAALLDRTKSDKEEVKQGARNDAILLVEGLMQASYKMSKHTLPPEVQKELRDFEDDLSAFLPILHERSAPLKLIFEHILLIIPKTLTTGTV